MKFTKDANPNMTSRVGYVETYYHRLVEVFGEPDSLGGDKTTCEWCLEFEDGTIATIYDWKEYTTPMGLNRWHIGGKNYMAEIRVLECLGLIEETA